jgi:hypothetical protein
MGKLTGGRAWAPKRLRPSVDVYRWPTCMHRLPLHCHRVRESPRIIHFSPKNAEVLIYLSCNCHCRLKALLFTLVRAFEFELALPADEIVRKSGIVDRPVVASNPAAGPQLPLLVRPANVD